MTAGRRARIGILGGTFNPVHLGHLLIAQDALESGGLDRVLFVPAATPPHKSATGLADAAHRLRMVRLAIRGEPRFVMDDMEIRRGGKSYSVDTVAELRRRQPEADFYFIIGTDSLDELASWQDAARLVKLCKFIAVARPGADIAGRGAAAGVAAKVRIVCGHACSIASRDIRARVARGLSIRFLVPDAVLRYIHAQKLYR